MEVLADKVQDLLHERDTSDEERAPACGRTLYARLHVLQAIITTTIITTTTMIMYYCYYLYYCYTQARGSMIKGGGHVANA